MSDERLIRLENLRRLVAERGLTPQSLSDRLGSRYSYWRDLLAGQKSFGEKAARRIEEGLDLPRGWLDQDMTEFYDANGVRRTGCEPEQTRPKNMKMAFTKGFEEGWRSAASWAEQPDLYTHIGSPTFIANLEAAFNRRRTSMKINPESFPRQTVDSNTFAAWTDALTEAAKPTTGNRYSRRRARLLDMIRALGGEAELSYAYGLPMSHIRAILSGERRISEDLAARLERLAGKPDGWMDTE